MSNPDISPVGFGGTDHPRSTLEWRRNVWWLLLGATLILVGVAGLVLFVEKMTDGEATVEGDRVAQGRVAALSGAAASPARFVVETAGPYTVWLDAGDVVAGRSRDLVVAAAHCTTTFADGMTSTFRGAVQGASVEFGVLATIGTFTAPPGAVEVACRSELFGSPVSRQRLEIERDFSVTNGGPNVGGLLFAALFVAIPAFIFGLAAVARGWTGSLRRRSPTERVG